MIKRKYLSNAIEFLNRTHVANLFVDLIMDGTIPYQIDEIWWDSNVSLKSGAPGVVPTWAQILGAYQAYWVENNQPRKLSALRRECKNRICLAYGETEAEDEMLKRLRNGHTAEQDTERERLRAKYTTIKASVTAMNYSTLSSFDPRVDNLWSA